ncbi:MAG: DUF362 domain-containing protein [Syntrophobacteraceae bacterium]|jgi:uncharacterized protein (DUF362 family)
MSSLKGIGLEFKESMSGWVGIGAKDYVDGRIAGEKESTPARIDAKIIIDDLASFIEITDHHARLEGVFAFKPLGDSLTIEDGTFNLFTVEPVSGVRQMTYSFRFTADNGKKYFFFGQKDLKDDPGFNVVKDMTTLFTDIYEGPDKNGSVYAKGQLFFALKDTISLMASMKVTGATWFTQKIQARLAFFDFAWGALKEEYLHGVNPLYDTEYENLVLSGKLLQNGAPQDFFLVSGVHDKDFPWGDRELFWDVLLVIRDAAGGYKRYAITDRTLEGLKLNVGQGTYHYKGPIYEVTDGYATSFSDIRKMEAGLVKCDADFTIRFRAKPYDITPFPFPVANDVLAKMATVFQRTLQSILPAEVLLGIFITPHTVTVDSGSLDISTGGETADYTIDTAATFGEAERSTFRNIKEPTLLYGYICAVTPGAQTARVQIHSNALRTERQHMLRDQTEAILGAVISRVGSKEMLMEGGKLTIRNLWPMDGDSPDTAPSFEKVGEPILEVNNDQYPTAVFQRRIVEVKYPPSGEKCLALEEDMDLMRLEAENSSKEAVVASIRNPDDAMAALDEVLNKTGFMDVVEKRRQETRKPKDQFSIVIKPNFMFAYNVCDHTTYTDPKLVEHLVYVLRQAGYEDITVVEAQSTYGQYFDKRRVLEVAEYLGFTTDGGKGYKMIDLTEDQNHSEYLGPHLGNHPVPVTWKNADFRVSFAKNKTHCYAYYTLTLKNIYGALPMANKFKEYHTSRDIYYTTMEYLQAFPIHFGLIDAYLSADGPFGIFADAEGNPTKTIIGGEDLVAVDWVGASKMGLQPKISKYMELAVQTFGKPEIKLIGDRNPYRPWLNVPAALSMFTNFGLDANYYFGNLVYMSLAYMDESHFTFTPGEPLIRAARMALKPLQLAVFLQAGGERTLANKLFSKFEKWIASH